MDDNMLKFIEIRNSYVRPKIGELSINEKALAEYEKFCFDLINQLKKLKEINKKAIEYVEEHRIKNPYHYEFNCFMGNARASDLLQILEDKEVPE